MSMILRGLSTIAAAMMLALPAAADIDIQEITSPQGTSAWLVEDHTIPFVALDIRFQGGTSIDPEGKRGAVYFMTGLLEEGAGDLDAQAYAQQAEALAAQISFSSYRDSVAISAQFLSQNRDEAADLLRDALVSPRFDESAIERVRTQILSIIESHQQDPDELGAQAFNAQAYGNHPYASPEQGTLETITTMTRDNLVAAHRAALTRDRVFIGAAGDITAEELGVLIDRLIGDLPAEGPALPGPAEYALEGGITVVDYPTPQSVTIFGHEGIERTDEDFFPAFVLNQILGGGGFQSRLMNEVRVNRGLTYGIYSYLSLADWQPMLLGQFSSSNNLVAEAIEVTRSIWQDMAENGVTEEELEAAKLYMTGAYPLRFDGNGTIAGILAGMQQDGMPTEYINTRNDRVNAVTMEDIRRVAARLLQPDGLRFVVVGQPEGLTPTE
ncbi:M16 family metallopeptidase [Rhodophyticola sp. SM2404]